MEAMSPVLNKVGQFLSIPAVRDVVIQRQSCFDLRAIMDDGKIFIANLSKGKLGEDASALFGALLITKFELAALSRADRAVGNRRDFYLYVDEFPTLATPTFAGMFSESRKYGLNLIVAMQYLDQVDESLRNALLENVGSLIVFRVGPESAESLGAQLGPLITEQDVMNLERYRCYVRLMIDGQVSSPFSARTLPLREP